MFPFLAFIGPFFTAVGNIAGGWFKHKLAKTEAARDVELASITAQVEIQTGSWKDEYLVILWTLPILPAIFDAVLHWDPEMKTFLRVVDGLPGWYTGLLITITGASFGVRSLQNWKAAKLDREITWDRHETVKKNGNGKQPVSPDPYAAVRPSPLPPEA